MGCWRSLSIACRCGPLQIAAHLQQKLYAAEQERQGLEAQLQVMEAQLQERQGRVGAAKRERARLKAEKEELRQDWSVVRDRRCLADLAAQQANLEVLSAQAAALQQELAALAGS